LNSEFDVKEFDRNTSNPEEYRRLATFQNRIQAEAMPGEPPRPVEHFEAEFRHAPEAFGLRVWKVGAADDTIVALGWVAAPLLEGNLHLAQFGIQVLPEWRRRKLGTALLRSVVDLAREKERRLLVANTRSTVPSGEAFMARLGAEVGLRVYRNQLKIEDVDRDLLRRWQEQARERASEFRLGLWEGRYPEDQIDAILELRKALNSMPTGDLDVGDLESWTADQLREFDDALEARGDDRWTMYAREVSTGKLVGYTEMLFTTGRPEVAEIEATAVVEACQKRGLGRWLKAAMMDKLLRERPQVRLIRTGNAQANAPMLKINDELGFKPLMASAFWQLPLDLAQAYLDSQ